MELVTCVFKLEDLIMRRAFLENTRFILLNENEDMNMIEIKIGKKKKTKWKDRTVRIVLLVGFH